MKRFIIALMIVCMAIGLASCNQYPPPPPLFGGDDPGIVMITTYQQMKSLLSGSGSGTYYLDNVPFAADAEAVDVNGKKNILGSVDVNGAGTQVVAKGIAAKADPSETSEPIVIFRIADRAEVSFSNFTANVKASVAGNVEIISVDAGKLSASNVEVKKEASPTASVVGIAIGTKATAENISVVNSASASITIAKGNENALDIVKSIRQENPEADTIPEIETSYDVADASDFLGLLGTDGKVRLSRDIELTAANFIGFDELKGIDARDRTYLKFSSGTYDIDLNGHSLTSAVGWYLPESETEPYVTVSVSNGELKMSHYPYWGKDNGSIQLLSNASLTFESVNYASDITGIFLADKSHGMKLNITDSNMDIEGYYGIGTNATGPESYDININIKNSTITTVDAQGTGNDNVGILFNVQGTVTIEDSRISADNQPMIARGGTHIYRNTTFDAKGTNTFDNGFLDGPWQTGNAVPMAALVIGNRVNNNSYPYGTNVTLDNVTVIAPKTNKCSTPVEYYGIYIWQNKPSEKVSVIGDVNKGDGFAAQKVFNDVYDADSANQPSVHITVNN